MVPSSTQVVATMCFMYAIHLTQGTLAGPDVDVDAGAGADADVIHAQHRNVQLTKNHGFMHNPCIRYSIISDKAYKKRQY